MRMTMRTFPLVHLAAVLAHLPSHAQVLASSSSATSLSSSVSYPDCEGIVPFIGDGDCDTENNNDHCGYDGGDCRSCTCSDTVDYI